MSKVGGVRAASSQIRFEDTIRSVPLYLITAYPCALEHGQTTRAQITGECNVGNLKVNTQTQSLSHTQHPVLNF